MTLADKILLELSRLDGLSDRQLSEAIFGTRHRSTQITVSAAFLKAVASYNAGSETANQLAIYSAAVSPNSALCES